MIQHKYKYITSSLLLDFCKTRKDCPGEHLNQREVVEGKAPGPQCLVNTTGCQMAMINSHIRQQQ